jgi:hypothetical protein
MQRADGEAVRLYAELQRQVRERHHTPATPPLGVVVERGCTPPARVVSDNTMESKGDRGFSTQLVKEGTPPHTRHTSPRGRG